MNLRRTRPAVVAMAMALVAPLLAACGGGAAAGSDDVLRLGYFPNITHAPALVGVKNGIFQDKLGDIKLETSTYNAGPSAIEALFSGAIDATYIGPNPAINGWSQSAGQGLRIIAGSTSGGAGLVVNESITSVQDLKGTKIASPQLGNTQDVALRHWLKSQGFATDAEGGGDVSVTPTENAEVLNAFTSGAVAGAWVPEPYLSRLVIDGGGTVLVDEADLWPDTGGQFVTTHLIVRKEFLDAHPDSVKKLLEGHIAAVDHVTANPEEAAAAANEQLEALSGKPLAGEVLTAAFANLSFTVDPVAASLAASAAHAEEVGLLDPVDLKGIYHLGPLNELLTAAGEPEVGAGDLAS